MTINSDRTYCIFTLPSNYDDAILRGEEIQQWASINQINYTFHKGFSATAIQFDTPEDLLAYRLKFPTPDV